MNSLQFENQWGFIIAIVGILLVALEMWRRKRFSISSIVRILWICLLGWCLIDGRIVQNIQWSQPEAIRVFIDRSDSIAKLSDRKARAEKIVEEIHQWSTEKKLPIHLYSFGDHLFEENFSVQWGALKTLLQPAEEAHEGANIVISDGLWTDYAHFHSPTFTVNVGESSERDVWIEKVQPVFTAFLKNRLKIPVTIGQSGFTGKKAMVSFWAGGERVSQVEVRLLSNFTTTEFTYFPERMGEQICLIKIEPMDGEMSALNNEVPFKIRTVRDKIRVLHINGKPSLDLKAWRAFLTRQPDVDLVSFYILRTFNDDPEARNSELSLIPFPYEELFSTELERFDVVILQNFDFNLYFPPFYLTNLAGFVSRGGALLMIGGDQGFQRYRDSPLESVFPFRYESGGEFEESISSVDITSDHPLIAGLGPDFQIPTWTARHRISPRADSTTLVQFKNGSPFLSIRDAEKGRVAAINSDELWKLQMQPTSHAPAFGKLARRLLQYLTFDPEVEPKSIRTGRWKVGQEVTIELATHEKTNWKITSRAFQNFEADFKNESLIRFKVPFPGVFAVKADASNEAPTFQTDEQPWLDEWKNLISSETKLRQLADDSHGKYFDFDHRQKLFDQPLSGKQMTSASISSWIESSKKISWLFLLLTITLMCLDFFLRKKNHWDA